MGNILNTTNFIVTFVEQTRCANRQLLEEVKCLT